MKYVFSCQMLYQREQLNKFVPNKNRNKWIKNWLSNSIYREIVINSPSSWGEISSRVPQGSILGPILFNIFIKYLEDKVENLLIELTEGTTNTGELGIYNCCWSSGCIKKKTNTNEEWVNVD